MKLIIDITENEYRHIKEYYEKNDTVEATYSYIYHGKPLDGVLQEIRQEIENNRNEVCTDIDDEIAYHVNCGLYSGLDSALKIIDRHIKEYTDEM